MAVWIYAYGRNTLSLDPIRQKEEVLRLLNGVELDALQILETVKPTSFARTYYTEERASLKQGFDAMEETAYSSYLRSMGFPNLDADALIDRFIADGEQREREAALKYDRVYGQLKAGTLQALWQACENGSFVNRLGYFNDDFDGIKLWFINDLVRIQGPFSVFSKYFHFLQNLSKRYRDCYHNYFKNILAAFESPFILYAHEWSGMDDEDNPAFDFNELEASAMWDETSSETLDAMDRFYYEPLG